MKPCWVCGRLVTPNVRRVNCSDCNGSVVTLDKPPKKKQGPAFRELERMMSSVNTYERVGGKVRQRRQGGE